MDQETLTNHLSRLGKEPFKIACRIVLRSVFNLNAINVDGSGDGGTDFISLKGDGTRSNVAYQITTQKTDIERKAYQDAKKTIKKLGVDRFYFLSTLNLSETEARKIEHDISKELGIQSLCFGAKHIAGFLIENRLLNQFLDEANYPLPRGAGERPDYREMALHAYTIMSKDAISMREGIYDDTILEIIFESEEIEENALTKDVLKFLDVMETKEGIVRKRIGALFGHKLIRRLPNGKITLSPIAKEDLILRKRIYEGELENLAAAQIDLMRKDFNSDWSIEDSKLVSVFIADAYIAQQIDLLKEVKASIVINPIFHVEEKGVDSLKKILIKNGKVLPEHLNSAVKKLILGAGGHPLINKLARASVYIALEGADPIVSSKALGAARWSDYHILLEPTVAIPWICSQLYKGPVNCYFDCAIRSVERTIELDASAHITYFYINECAGHLLRARKYEGLALNPEELKFSPNAYISNYFSLKEQGVRLPDKLLEYLQTFSPSVLVPRYDIKEWVRSVMTDLQTILNRSGVEFIESPKYAHRDCATFEKEYLFCLDSYKMDKPTHLINHDVWALQFTNDLVTREGQHWLILTYDRSMLEIGRGDQYKGWIATPNRFMDLTELYRPLVEAKYISLIHAFATYSERTLSAGARIIDRIVQYASTEMQNWEFCKEVNEFKSGTIDKTDLDEADALQQIDNKTDKFLEAHGIKVTDRKLNEEEEVD
jgi:hypothetical protein